MEFTVRTVQPEKSTSACLIVPIMDGTRLGPAAAALDKAAEGAIAKALRDGDLPKEVGASLLLRALPGIRSRRVLLVRLGAAKELNDARFRKGLGGACRGLARLNAKDAVTYLAEAEVPERDLGWRVRQLVDAFSDSSYRFDATKEKSKGEDGDGPRLQRLTIATEGRRETRAAQQAVREGSAIAAGKKLAKDLGNLPGNRCTPSYLADQARALARGQRKLAVQVLDEAQMQKLGMGSLLSVSRGSREPAKLICLQYNGGNRERRPVVLVGKGVTFDSGGISIKPSAAMDEMKFDMCGAASVLGVMRAALELELQVNLVGIIPATENLPDGNASKPGDVVKSMSGRTIEVLNTDAEGRLILCDALTYAERYDPDVVIDIATLTGACVVALGSHPSGLFANHAKLADDLVASGTYAHDRVWPMPLWEDYQDQLKSNFADVANVGGRSAGAITAACFLARFTESFRWAHLDIAGTAWNSGNNKGSTGRPVALLVQYLLDQAGSQRKKRAA